MTAGKNKLVLTGSRQFISWLAEHQISLSFSTYQAGKLFFVGLSDTQELSVFERTFSRCMGIVLDPQKQALWVDNLYKRRNIKISRRLPAIIGFILAAFGMLMMANIDTPQVAILFLSIAIFGADMTLSPSWTFCIDIGKEHAGAVSGTMNMAGNLGAFVTIIAFPYLYEWTGSFQPFFYVCVAFSVIAIVIWLTMDPEKVIKPGKLSSL